MKRCAPGQSVWHSHRISPVDFAVLEYGWPGNFGRWEASQATTSETSCADIGFPGNIAAPVRSAEFGAAHDYDRAKLLIVEQREERSIDDRACLLSAAAAGAVAGRAVSRRRRLNRARHRRARMTAYGGGFAPRKTSGFAQRSRIPLDDRIDLFIGEHAAGALREGGHGSSWNSIRGRATQESRRPQSPGTQDRQERSPLRLCRLTPWHPAQFCAVEYIEIGNFARNDWRVARPPAARVQSAHPHKRAQRDPRLRRMAARKFIAVRPALGFLSMIPGASKPARIKKGTNWRVRTRCLPHHDQSRDNAKGELRGDEPRPTDELVEQRIR